MSAVTQIRPMLAKKGELPVGPGWLYEVKWDGVRCTATVEDGKVVMQSRSAKSDFAGRFLEVAEQLAELPNCVIDGELVTLNGEGETFGLNRGGGGVPTLVIFDVLEMWNSDVRQMPLDDRRRVLTDVLGIALAEQSRLAISPVFEDGEKLLAWVAERGLEGVVAKRRTSRYVDNSRRGEWIKVKPRPQQEFVVVGWTPGNGARAGGIGGLLLGYYDESGSALLYAGRVGGKAVLDADFRSRLRPGPLPLLSPGLSNAELRRTTWVVPEVVVEVAFQRWTDDLRLWHPTLVRIREDKDAADVRRER